MKYIKNGRIIIPGGEIKGKVLVFSGNIVDIIDEKSIGEYGFGDVIDAEGGIVSPGLIDIHIHGNMGEDISDGNEDGLLKMSKSVVKTGVTAFLPTTMTLPISELEKSFDIVRKYKDKETGGAVVLGVNAEGPFIAPSKKGAQKAENIRKADAEFVIKNSDVIKLTTIAPEQDGALEQIKKIKENSDVIVSIGHSDANYGEAMEAFSVGVSHATHLFNAMTGLLHREPGTVGAVLTSDNVYCELIADTIHIHKALFKAVYELKKDKLILITDSTRAGGLGNGQYDLGGQMFTLTDGKCLLPDGTLAGSVLRLNDALRNFRDATGLENWQVIKLATLNPATELGDNTRGSLEKGKKADIVIFDDVFNVKKVFVSGREIKNI